MTRHILDAETILRAAAESAEGSSAAETPLATDSFANHHERNKALAGDNDMTFKAVFHNIVLAGDAVATSVTFYVEFGDAVGFGGEVARVVTLAIPDTSDPADRYEANFSLADVLQRCPNATHVRCGVVISGGTNPTVDYQCFLTKA